MVLEKLFKPINSNLPQLPFCGISLKQGTILIGIIYTAIAFFFIIVGFSLIGSNYTSDVNFGSVLLSLALTLMCCSVLLLVGVFMEKPKYLEPFVVFVIFTAAIAVSIMIHRRLFLRDTDKVTNDNCWPAVFVSMFVALINVYIVMITNSYHNKLLEKNAPLESV